MAGSPQAADARYMAVALSLARRGAGRVHPNPAVGCVLVRDGRIVGRGWTAPGGRPHAETEALARAGAAARGATAYVTLEPCAHHGRTPPCADALVEAGVARVVSALEDPDSRVAGKGHARLVAAGITVEVGLCAREAAAVNAGFLSRVTTGRPLVTLKLATTLDGRIAAHGGASRWITGPAAREAAHGLRARHDAIMVGSGTALTDDPSLTCRLPGLAGRSPVRVIVDRRLRLPLTASVVATAAEAPTWLVTESGADRARCEAYEAAGVEIIRVGGGQAELPDPAETLAALGERGITSVLLEGGAHLAAAVLRAGLVDRVEWFHAPALMGGDGIPAVMAFGVDDPARMPRFEILESRAVGPDRWTRLIRAGA
ncbi:MAG: bifunctional diaminohydroxyphosphoribosylaminopyrimidine deaminase/5-amino-6-(5-phosphoribosylamino)uracil reductase RibD [Azospirillaceae bacterium]